MGEGGLGNLVHNDRIKYAATFWNGISITAVGAGMIVPLFNLDPVVDRYRFVFIGVGAILGVMCRIISHFTLRHLKE
jgi:hypothetical protein